MYRIINKYGKRGYNYTIQRRYGIFWINVMEYFGLSVFIIGLIVFLSILIGIFISSKIGAIGIISSIVFFGISTIFVEKYRIFKRFGYLTDAKDYVTKLENEKEDKMNRKREIIYMNEKDERADKLRRLKYRHFLFFLR